MSSRALLAKAALTLNTLRMPRRNRNRQKKKRTRRPRPQQEERKIDVGMQQVAFPVLKPSKRMLGGFSPTATVRLKYVTHWVLDSSGASTAYADFGLNCLYDTDISGSGHQPTNFDLFTQIYRRYTVTRTWVRMSWSSQTATSQTPGYFGFLVTPYQYITSGKTANELFEQPYCQYSRVPYNITTNGVPPSVSAEVPVYTMFGVSRAGLIAEDNYSGDSGSNPADILYCQFFTTPINGNAPASADFRFELEYEVVWKQPKVTEYS